MNKIFLLLISIVSLSFSLELNRFKNLDLALIEANKQNKKIMVFFHGKQCPYCDKMKKTTLKDKKVIEYINSKYIFVSIDEEDNPNVDQFVLDYIPATYILDTKQKTVYYTYGYRTSENFIGELNQNIK
jgi:thioredoxin-related protein